VSAAATGRDLARAFAMAGSTFPFAVGIAFASAAVQLFGTSALHEAAELLAVNDPGELPALILAVWLHAVFIVTVAARATDPSEPASVPLFRAGISGGTILAAPILLFALLDSADQRFCARTERSGATRSCRTGRGCGSAGSASRCSVSRPAS
jgi:hypothetical protein